MKLSSILFAAAALVVASPALAQSDDVTESKAEDGWTYRFKDDLLGAPGVDAGGPVISVRPVAMRERLIRPRLSFVQEMFKSAEKL